LDLVQKNVFFPFVAWKMLQNILRRLVQVLPEINVFQIKKEQAVRRDFAFFRQFITQQVKQRGFSHLSHPPDQNRLFPPQKRLDPADYIPLK
jgi:hypothetical protein